MNRIARLVGGTAVAATVVLSGPGIGVAFGAQQAGPSAQDRSWMIGNAQTNLAEITTGTMAETKAQSAENRRIGRELVSDHVTAMAKLKALAKTYGVTLPTAPNAMQQAAGKTLMSLSGQAFDAKFDSVQIMGHQMSIAMTKKELSSGSNSAVMARARAYLPVAQMHLRDTEAAAGTNQTSQVPNGDVDTGGGGTVGVEHEGLLSAGGAALGAGCLLAGGLAFTARRRRSQPDRA